MFSDILGTMKNVEIPATDEQLDKVLSNKAMFDGSSIEGFVRINESDMYLYPDLDTWTVFPWGDENGSVAGLICDVYTTEGEPFAGDPRGNLKRALRHMEEVGFKSFNLGPEPEFFLFKLDENGDPTLEVNDKGGYFDLAPTDLADNTRREIVNVLTKMGFEVEASHHEVAVGQHEIDFKYDEVLRACDKIQIFKLVVKTIARKHGLYATFMAKPKFGIAGSGMHCNMSLFDAEGNNAFFDPNDPKGMQLSETAYHFLGGLIKHAYNYTAIITQRLTHTNVWFQVMKRLFTLLGLVVTVRHLCACLLHVVWELVLSCVQWIQWQTHTSLWRFCWKLVCMVLKIKSKHQLLSKKISTS